MMRVIWHDSTDYRTGYRSAVTGEPGSWHAVVRQISYHTFTWHVSLQHPESEGPDEHGSWWDRPSRCGFAPSFTLAKPDAGRAYRGCVENQTSQGKVSA
jgi:hypothetical protein